MFGVSSLLTAAVACGIQTQVSLDYSFSMTEVHAGTNVPVSSPNGVIEPGEAVLFRLTVSFTPPVGTVIPGLPPPSTVAGLSWFFFHFGSLAGGHEGTWSHLALAPGWQGRGVGSPSGWLEAELYQFPLAGQTADPQNPVVNGWSQVWTPNSYAPRTINWLAQPAAFGGWGGIFVETGTHPQGGPLYTPVNTFQAPSHLFPVTIIPGPGSFAIGLWAGALASRRRRPVQ
jgi:hypothetical protein